MKRILRFVPILVFALFGCTSKTTNSVSSIQIIPGDNLLSLNLTRNFTAIALDSNGNALNVKNFTWASSDPSVASVIDGQVTANKLGLSQITASANNITSVPVKITVLEAIGTLSSTNASDLMPVLLLGRRLIAAIGLNPAKFAFPRPPLATDLDSTPFGSTVTVSGDNTDNDGDGVPNDATSTFAGTYRRGVAALNYSGTVRTQDSSTSANADTRADATTEFSNLKLEGTLNAQAYSYTLNGRQSLKNNGTHNDSMTLTGSTTLDLTAFGRTSTLEFVSSAQFVPDDAGSPLAGGTFDWQDAIKSKLAGSSKILLERGEGVHLGTCGQYDSGRIVMLDASASLNTLEFGPGCGEVQLTRDGNSLVPTLGGTLTVSPSTVALKYGQSQQFTATALSIAGELISLPTGSAIWNSSLPTFASINTNGLATAQSITGITYITASAFGKTSIAVALSVTAPAVANVTITPISTSIAVGGTQAFVATAKDASNNVIPGQTFTWNSSLPTIATIGSTTGIVTGVAIGTSSITAKAGLISSTPAILTVTDFTLTALPTAVSVLRPSTTSDNFNTTITPINGFAGAVAYSLEGAPVGVSLTTVIATNPSTLNLSVPASVLSSVVPYPFKLVATSGTAIRKADMTLSVGP